MLQVLPNQFLLSNQSIYCTQYLHNMKYIIISQEKRINQQYYVSCPKLHYILKFYQTADTLLEKLSQQNGRRVNEKQLILENLLQLSRRLNVWTAQPQLGSYCDKYLEEKDHFRLIKQLIFAHIKANSINIKSLISYLGLWVDQIRQFEANVNCIGKVIIMIED